MEVIEHLIETVNAWLWNTFLIVVLCGTGVFFTFRLRFVQIRKFGAAWKHLLRQIFSRDVERKEGEMTPFQSLATAIAAQVGTGNLAGAATALAGGGPGAIFWMWMSAFFGMATVYAEATLAQVYKTTVDGEVTGGPTYYIRQAFKGTFGRVLAVIFAVFLVLALGFMGNMVQANSVSAAFSDALRARGIQVPGIVIGIVIAAFAGVIFIGGTDRLAAVVEKFVPMMAVVYICGSVLLIVMNADRLPGAVSSIFVGALDPQAVAGGAAGITVREAIRYGVARGLFSNEAGMGSTPHAHARANAKNPHEQGLTAMISVFIDTFIVLNLTVFSILCSGVLGSGKEGIALTQAAFVEQFGSFGDLFVSICLFFFAFSTILGWHFFGAINAQYLFGKKAVRIYSALVVAFIVIGSTLKVDLVWSLADTFNGLMVVPNAMALLALSGVVARSCRKYEDQTK